MRIVTKFGNTSWFFVLKLRSDEMIRGEIIEISLSAPLVVNGVEIFKIKMEIDHINYGLNAFSKELNKIKRSHFSAWEIAHILNYVTSEALLPVAVDKCFTYFALEFLYPTEKENGKKKFRIVFKLLIEDADAVEVITLYRIR
jgi:hypothetical protein